MKRLPGALGLGAFCLYAWFAAPGMYWLDAQELGSAAVRLGIAHPTGAPLFTFLGHVAALVPFGELAFRVHLLCAASAAVAVGATAALVIEVAGDDRAAGIAAAAAAIVFGASLTFFRHATATEVYAPTAAAFGVALLWLLRPERSLALAFFAGIAAIGLHGSFRLLLFVPVAGTLLVRFVRGRRELAAAPFLAVLGAAAILVYMPVRSATGRVAALDWGHTASAAGLADHVLAGRIRRAFVREMFAGEGTGRNLAAFGELVEGDLGALALVAAAGGAAALLLRRRHGAAALLLFVVAGEVAYATWVNPMGTRDRQNGVFLAMAAAVLAGAGIAGGAGRLGRAGAFVAAALGVAVVVEPVWHDGAARLAVARSDAPRAWAEAALAELPPRGVALLRSDDLAAGLLWLTLAEPVRPDVAALVRQHLWDVRRTRALVGVDRPTDVRDRAIGWEIGDDPLPGPARLDLPLALLGQRGVGDATPTLARVFRDDTLGDPETRATARRAWNRLGVFDQLRGDTAAAAAAAERSIAIADDAGARVNAARYRLALGDDARAQEHAERAVALDERRAAGWALLGVVAARAGRCEDAKARFERALALDPNDEDARANLPKLGCR